MSREQDKRWKWTEEQEAMIRELYPTLGSKLAERLNVDPNRLKDKAVRMGVKFGRWVNWTQEIEDEIRNHYQEEGPAKLAQRLGLPLHAVVAKSRRMGVGATRKCPPKGFKWTDKMLAAIKSRYVDEGPIELAKEFGATVDMVRDQAVSFGLHTIAGRAVAGRRRAEASTSCDIHYFDNWTPSMAYVLGFLFADGCVSRGLTSISVLVSRTDEEVLHFIKSEMKATTPIRYSPPTPKKDGTLTAGYAHFYVSSTILVEKAVSLGLKPRKSFNDYPFPEVPDDVMPDFVRGFFDGDGTASTYVYSSRGAIGCSIGFIGSPRFITSLRDHLVRLAGMRCAPITIKKGKTTYVATVSWGALDDVTAFHKFVYPERGFSFWYERKKKRLDDWLVRSHRGSRRPVPWTIEEEVQVRNLYHEIGPSKLAKLLNRDRAVVSLKAKELGLKPLYHSGILGTRPSGSV